MMDAATTNDGMTTAEDAAETSAESQRADTQEQAASQQETADATEADTSTEADASSTEAEEGETSAPESYEFKEVDGEAFNPAVLDAFSDAAKELGMSQDAAQSMLDKVAPVIRAQQAEAAEQAKAQWADDSRADKEFGGDKLNENIAVAEKAIETFGTPELRTLLEQSGLGNHPEVIRFAYRAGKAISDDGFVSGQNVVPESDPAKRMYPNHA